jgi:hypothetical protein
LLQVGGEEGLEEEGGERQGEGVTEGGVQEEEGVKEKWKKGLFICLFVCLFICLFICVMMEKEDDVWEDVVK